MGLYNWEQFFLGGESGNRVLRRRYGNNNYNICMKT